MNGACCPRSERCQTEHRNPAFNTTQGDKVNDGYHFQIDVWQPSEQPRCAVAQDPQPVDNGRQPSQARQSRRLVDIAACWQHAGFAACSGNHEATYDTALCSEIFSWLALDIDKPTSHGTRRPACMIGALAAYVARHPSDKPLVRIWCIEYRRHCHPSKGAHVTLDSVRDLYGRIAAKKSTDGSEKIRVFFNTFMTIKAYCKGHKEIAFSDPPESVAHLIDPAKAT
jgi:hypothetical protein